ACLRAEATTIGPLFARSGTVVTSFVSETILKWALTSPKWTDFVAARPLPCSVTREPTVAWLGANFRTMRGSTKWYTWTVHWAKRSRKDPLVAATERASV